MERLDAKRKFTLKITATRACPQVNKRQHGMIQNDTATRMIRASRQTGQKTRGGKPQSTFSLRNTMGVLQTNNIHNRRQKPQPLNETSPFRLVSNSVTIKSEYRQSHDEREEKETQPKIRIWY